MRLDQLGEFGLIKHFAPLFMQNLPIGVEGIGDDCAIIPYQLDKSLIVTTDLLIENVHFLRSKISPEDLGHKSLAVNLSDIAAMGGTPLYAFLSIAFPPDIEIPWVDRFFNGLDKLAKKEQVLLLGGDTISSPSQIIINILVLGEIKTEHIKRRTQALPGDFICCTGYLGNSGAGLKVLLENLPLNETTNFLIHEHHHPSPHLRQGKWLATQPAVHAMIDVSDGIDSDIHRIMEQSHCGAEIDLDRLPISKELLQATKQFNWNAQELAATSGEDYCLLITVDPQGYEKLNQEYQSIFQYPLFQIGRVTEQVNLLSYYLKNQSIHLQQKGFDHFAKLV
jgi:thiamine-monophosphate kinase